MRRLVASCIVLALGLEAPFAFAIDSKGASYYGGTITTFKGAKDPVEGTLDTQNEKALIFSATDKPFKGKTFSIPYDHVIDLEYGQKAGRRIGTAVATTALPCAAHPDPCAAHPDPAVTRNAVLETNAASPAATPPLIPTIRLPVYNEKVAGRREIRKRRTEMEAEGPLPLRRCSSLFWVRLRNLHDHGPRNAILSAIRSSIESAIMNVVVGSLSAINEMMSSMNLFERTVIWLRIGSIKSTVDTRASRLM